MQEPVESARSKRPATGQDAAPRRRSGRPGFAAFLGTQLRGLVVAALIAAVVAIAIVPWLLSSPARISRLIAAAAPELEADVAIDTVRLGWTGPLAIEGVRLVPRDGTAPPVAIRRIAAANGLAGMLLSGGDLGRVRIEGLEVDVVFDEQRQSNLARLTRPREDARPDATATPRRSPVRLDLEVDGAIVRIAGPWTTEPWVSDPINVRAALGPSPDGPYSEWTVAPVQLLTDARMEPGVAQGVLAYIAPVLADATRTAGRFSLRLDGARLPVGQPAAGTLSGELAMHEVVLGPGPMVLRTFQSLPIRLPPPPNVLIADESRVQFHLADRRVWHRGLEFGIPLAKPGQRLDVESSGSVGLDDRSLDVMLQLPFPADLPEDRPVLAALAGKEVSLGIGGELGEPKVKFNGSIGAVAGDVAAELIDRLRASRQPRAEAPRPQPRLPMPGPVTPPVAAPAPRTAAERGPADAAATANAGAADGARDARQVEGRTAGGGQPDEQTAEAIVDLVGGVLDEVAKRRAERRAAEAAGPEPARPRRPLLRRILNPPPLTSPQPGAPAPAPQPAP
jgi:hypothetical protein